MREIVLDTETTGLNPANGDRIVEIACLEIFDGIATGKTYQAYINPRFPMSPGALAVCGLTDAFLSQHKLFEDIVEDFLTFISDSPLVIHNAAFDLKFLNAEFARLDMPAIPANRAIDTVYMARKKFPGSPASLDALCRRFEIDNTNRVKHGALIDVELLAEVYLELIGGRQRDIGLQKQEVVFNAIIDKIPIRTAKVRANPVIIKPSPEEANAHSAFLQEVNKPLWGRS